MPEEQPQMESRELGVRWVGLDEMPIIAANQIIAQVQSGEVFLTFGQAAPPALLGSPEEVRKQAEELEFVPVRTVVRLHITPARLADMVAVLQETLAKHELQQQRLPATASAEDEE